jgi:type IV secretory pathway protease TraF
MGIEVSKTLRMTSVLLVAAAVAWVAPRLDVVRTPSIRYTLMWIEGGPGNKGDYVSVPVSSPFIHHGLPSLLTKRIACVAGETLSFRDGQHFCDGIWLDRVLTRTSSGKPLAPWTWDGPVPPGKVFLLGDDPRSVDSRYLGFFDRASTTKELGLF